MPLNLTLTQTLALTRATSLKPPPDPTPNLHLVDAAAAGVLPHHRVDGHVRVEQRGVEPSRAFDPRDAEVLY